MVKDLGTYVIVTSEYTPSTCTSGVISSATVPQIDQATESLKKAKCSGLPDPGSQQVVGGHPGLQQPKPFQLRCHFRREHACRVALDRPGGARPVSR